MAKRSKKKRDELSTIEEIEAKLESGDLTPGEAREEVKLHGLRSLTVPDPEKFDPMAEAFWTIPMALVWIETRDTRKVLEVMDAYIAAHHIFVPFHDKHKNKGWLIEPTPQKVGLIIDAVLVYGDPDNEDGEIPAAFERAETKMRSALLDAGEKPLTLEAQTFGSNIAEEVKPSTLMRLAWFDGGHQVRLVFESDPYNYAFTNPVMRKTEILAHWPKQKPNVENEPDHAESVIAPSDFGPIFDMLREVLVFRMCKSPDKAKYTMKQIHTAAVAFYGANTPDLRTFKVAWLLAQKECKALIGIPPYGWSKTGPRNPSIGDTPKVPTPFFQTDDQ